jgi:hypothetical protein
MYGPCEECQNKEATRLMYPTYAESRDQNARTPRAMCEECAWTAFEAGEYESDDNE